MKSIKVVQLFVLLSMFFNISHASLIAFTDDCEHGHETLSLELEHTEHDECDDLCDIHHLFHFSAILISQTPALNSNIKKLIPKTKDIAFLPLIKKTTIKPPIA